LVLRGILLFLFKRLVFPLLLLLLVLNLELLIGLRGYLDFVPDPIFYLRLILCSAAYDLIAEHRLIDYPVKRARCAKVLVIYVTVLCGEYSDEIPSLHVLLASLPDQFSLSHTDSFPHALVNRSHILLGVLMYFSIIERSC
jgi:hypothetical protein